MRKLSKIFAVAIASALVLSSAACSKEQTKSADEAYMEKGKELVSMLDESVKNDDYLKIYTSSEDVLAAVEPLVDGDYTNPKTVYKLSISDEDLLKLSEFETIELSADHKDSVTKKTLSSIIPMINGYAGVSSLAASSVLTASKCFDVKDGVNAIYLFVYEDTLPVAVIFVTGEDNAVSASATFVFGDTLKCGSVDEVKESFGYIPFEVEEIK